MYISVNFMFTKISINVTIPFMRCVYLAGYRGKIVIEIEIMPFRRTNETILFCFIAIL